MKDEITFEQVIQWVEELQCQNSIDFQGIKNIKESIKKLKSEITKAKNLNNSINKKILSEYEKIKKIILDENVSVTLDNKISNVNKLLNDLKSNVYSLEDGQAFEKKTNENIKAISSQLDNIASLSNNSNVDLMKAKRIAHRGYNVLAPENSIPAYELASEYGFWGGECDVAETLDNEFVLMHDDTIDRTTNGTGKVSSYTLNQLKAFNIDVGNNISSYPNLKIPTLDEFLLTCKKFDIVPIIEIKNITDNSIDKFLNIIRSYGFINKAVIISFNYDLLVKIRNKENRVMIQPLLNLNQENIDKCVNLGVNTHIDCQESQVTKELVELAHKKGLLINVWTVNNETKLNELIEYGVDFITTDKLYDEETVKYKLKTVGNNLSITANQITSIQLGSSANTPGMAYEELINKSLVSNRCSSINRFYRALNDTVVIDIPSEYKLTLMPFDSTGVYLRDLGWFSNGETDISSHTDVDHYHIYFARVDGGNFTDEDISNLKGKVSITFKTKTLSSNTRKYVFLINQAPMVLQNAYSDDLCTVTYDGDSTKMFTLTHNKPLTTSKIGIAFGNISLTGDLDIDIRIKSESKNGFKFAFIKKTTNTLVTETEINAKGWFYFNLVHIG